MPLTWKPKGGSPITSFREFVTSDGATIAVFQGSKGKRPDLDIVVKYRDRFTKGARLRTPKHIHWVIDLLLKREHNRKLTLEFVAYLLEMYDKVGPFLSCDEQRACVLKWSRPEALERFKELDQYGEHSVQFMACVMELLAIEEKTGFDGAFMFRGVLQSLADEKDIFRLVSAATHNGRF
jgi:hypothetical protein